MARCLFVTSFRNEGERYLCSLFFDSIFYGPHFRGVMYPFLVCVMRLFLSLCYVFFSSVLWGGGSLCYVWCLDALVPRSARVARFAR